MDVISAKRRNGDATLRIHRGELCDGEITDVDGVRVTTVARTLFDLCDRRLIAEAVARGLTTLEALEDFAERKRGARGARQFADAIGLPQYRSWFECCFHRWLRRRGFPEPELNVKIGRRTYDFVWRRHGVIVETDGPHHRTPAQRAVDEQVDREAAAHGYCVLRVAEEGFAARQDRVAALIWTALEAV
jgi:very-short-patch-repair endonuclease